MNHYHNPHPAMPFPNQQRPIQHQQPQYPQQHPQGYPQQPQYPQQQMPQQLQQPPYWATQQPGYHSGMQMPQNYPQQVPEQCMQMINTPQGQMVIDSRTGQVLGPVNQIQQPIQPRPMQNSQPFQGTLMSSSTGLVQPAQDRDGILPDNRYGNAGSLIKAKEAASRPEVMDVVEVPTFTPKATVSPKIKTLTTGYIPTYHSKPLTEAQTYRNSTWLVGATLESLASEVIEDAHAKDTEHLVWIQSGAVVQKFYKTSLVDKEAELYQTDIEKVYRAVKKIAPTINSRDDFVYFQAYNKWLTNAINTFLSIHMKDTSIDSFFDDFNDLIKFLIVDYDQLREQLVEHMTGILEGMVCDVKELRAVSDESPVPVISKDQSIISEHLTIVYIKIFSGEIGDDGSAAGLKVANKVIESIKALTGTSDFVLITLDRRFYRVTVMKDGEADIDCFRT